MSKSVSDSGVECDADAELAKLRRDFANVEMRRSGISGSAVLENGKPLAIVTLNQKKLELTVTKCHGANASKE